MLQHIGTGTRLTPASAAPGGTVGYSSGVMWQPRMLSQEGGAAMRSHAWLRAVELFTAALDADDSAHPLLLSRATGAATSDRYSWNDREIAMPIYLSSAGRNA